MPEREFVLPMGARVKLGEIDVQVLHKNVKHIRLRILEPSFEVRMSVPRTMPIEVAQMLAMSKHEWLAARLETLRMQYESAEPQRRRQSQTRLLWGERYDLTVIENSPAQVELKDGKISISIAGPVEHETVERSLDRWYRNQLTNALAPLVETWQSKMGTQTGPIVLQRMKTRWGTCNNATRRIRLNVELAKKPPAHLEYVLVHEMVHFFCNNHGADFQAAMDRHLPNWRTLQRDLQCFPRE